ncbi:MAG: PH domain-containing protein [Acidimicrobiia bacterium]
MSYPEKLLSDGESIVTQFRPHWSRLLREFLVVIVGIGVMVLLAIISAPGWAYPATIVVVLLLIARGLVRWATTMHVITDERVIFRAGFIAKSGQEIPLEVINDIAFNQTLFEKLFGTGDLLIESAGTHGQTRYRDIPKPEQVQSLLYQVREDRTMKLRGPQIPDGGESTASQLDRLSRLHDEGKLTDEEFQQEKSKLIGGS